jgi:hypothetical protein
MASSAAASHVRPGGLLGRKLLKGHAERGPIHYSNELKTSSARESCSEFENDLSEHFLLSRASDSFLVGRALHLRPEPEPPQRLHCPQAQGPPDAQVSKKDLLDYPPKVKKSLKENRWGHWPGRDRTTSPSGTSHRGWDGPWRSGRLRECRGFSARHSVSQEPRELLRGGCGAGGFTFNDTSG